MLCAHAGCAALASTIDGRADSANGALVPRWRAARCIGGCTHPLCAKYNSQVRLRAGAVTERVWSKTPSIDIHAGGACGECFDSASSVWLCLCVRVPVRDRKCSLSLASCSNREHATTCHSLSKFSPKTSASSSRRRPEAAATAPPADEDSPVADPP
eukprot:351343-Prymnesium_polylepis.1